MNQLFLNKTRHSGFTIVELLIVVVVIAILAAIIIVSYNGITRQAEISSVKSDLTSIAKKLESEKIMNGDSFTASMLTSYLQTETTGTTLNYRYGTSKNFCINAVSNKNSSLQYYIESSAGVTNVRDGACPATTSNATSLCISGNVRVAVTQQNYSCETVQRNITTPFGTSASTLAPGASTTGSFNTGVPSIDRGIVTIQMDSTTSNPFSVTRFHVYPARSC